MISVYNTKDGAREMSGGSGGRGPWNLWEASDNSKPRFYKETFPSFSFTPLDKWVVAVEEGVLIFPFR